MSRIRTPEAVMRQAVGFLEEEAREYFDASNDQTNPDRAYCLARSKRMFACAAALKFVSEHGEAPMGRDKSRAVAQMLRHHGMLPKLPPKDRRWERELAEYVASLSAPEASNTDGTDKEREAYAARPDTRPQAPGRNEGRAEQEGSE